MSRGILSGHFLRLILRNVEKEKVVRQERKRYNDMME